MDHKNKIAVITGAGSGIGRAVARTLSKDSWNIVLAGRREKLLLETAEACELNQTLVLPTDINNPNSVKHLFKEVLKVYGRLDLLFNNAGVNAPAKPLEELGLEEWQNVVNTNLTGAFLCIQEAFKIMKTQDPIGGRIINNVSLS